jgi:flagellar protein FlaG
LEEWDQGRNPRGCELHQSEEKVVMEALAAVKPMESKGKVPAPGSGDKPPARVREKPPGATEGPALKLETSFDRVERDSREKVERLAQVMDDYVRSSQRSLKIQVHSGTGRTIVRVISKEDGRTIREIPPEQLLNLAARMEEMIGGLFDEKV